MPYVNRAAPWIYSYIQSDDVVCIDPTETTAGVGSDVFVKAVSFRLNQKIDPDSLFRYKFEMKSTINLKMCYFEVRRNDSIVMFDGFTNTNVYQSFSENDPQTTWLLNDTVSLWVHGSVADGNGAVVKNFEICGFGSNWKKE